MPTNILASHPVRRPERVIRLHPMACILMNADFDGDQAAVFLPITEAAQREAGERLTIAGHLKRDPELIKWLTPAFEAMWGLASLSLTSEGRKEIESLAGTAVAVPAGFVTREAMAAALRAVLDKEGAEKTLERIERLRWRGLEVARESGASINPFIGAGLNLPSAPATEDAEAWGAHAEKVAERIASRSDFADDDMGPQLLAVKSGARGNLRQLTWLAGVIGLVKDTSGALVPIRHALRDGLTSKESFTYVVGAREGLARVSTSLGWEGYGLQRPEAPKGFSVLVRAMRARHPGVIFASAAATGESDPLNDVDSRLFVGLPV